MTSLDFIAAIEWLKTEPMFEELNHKATDAIYAALRLASKVKAGEVRVVPLSMLQWMADDKADYNANELRTMAKRMLKIYSPEYDWSQND